MASRTIRLTRLRCTRLPAFLCRIRISRNNIAQRIELRSYAFVEFRSQRDAEDAYYEMYAFTAILFETTSHMCQAWTKF